jgi:hypothetical protein
MRWPPKFWGPLTGVERFSFVLTCSIALFTVVNGAATAIYVSFTEKASKQTSAQAERLILAAQIQSRAASEMAQAAESQASKMAELAAQSTSQATAANNLATQALRANELAERNNSLARLSFAKDQRPWVWIATPELFHVEVGDLVMLNVQFINYGKTPAIARTSVFLYAETNLNPNTIKTLQQNQMPPYTMIIAPGQVPKPTFTTATSSEKLQKKDYDLIMSNNGMLVVGGRIEYTDLQGNPYESVFCVTRLATGAIANCPGPELNYMK